jgi:AcrR family transcriptional regulator
MVDIPAPRRPYAKGVARRKEILERAVEVFAERGAQGTSLRAIGEAIGVSHAALLHYFPSREELLVEALRTYQERPHPEEAADPRPGVVSDMIAAARRNVTVPGLVALYTSVLGASVEKEQGASRDYATQRFEGLRASLVARIVEGQRVGTVRADLAPESVAALIIAASDGLQVQWLLEPGVDITGSLEVLQRVLAPPA